MNHTSTNPNCTCNATRADYVCRCGNAELCDQIADPASLVNLVAILSQEGKPTHKANEQLRTALNRLIDERVEKRLAGEMVEPPPAPAKTRGQEMAEETIYQESNDGENFHVLWHTGGAPLILQRTTAQGASNAKGTLRHFLAELIDRAIAEEREACAVTAEGMGIAGPYVSTKDIAGVIRNRK